MNSSLLKGLFPAPFKEALVYPLPHLKKPLLDPIILDNFCPVSPSQGRWKLLVCYLPFTLHCLKSVFNKSCHIGQLFLTTPLPPPQKKKKLCEQEALNFVGQDCLSDFKTTWEELKTCTCPTGLGFWGLGWKWAMFYLTWDSIYFCFPLLLNTLRKQRVKHVSVELNGTNQCYTKSFCGPSESMGSYDLLRLLSF